MGTRRWVAELELWMRQTNLTKEELAERSKHSAPHVLALFKDADPNPTLELFLDLMQEAGARFHGVALNKPIEVIKRLKEIMARENLSSLSALAKVAGVNRSQLSTMWNQEAPNPMLATFERLVVALGAEQDFALVSIHDAAVAAAVAAGKAEVQAVKRAVKSHLYSVPRVPDEQNEQVEGHEEVKAKIAEMTAKLVELYRKNVELEKVRDDQAAEIVRLGGLNATLERLRAEDAAEIARLKRENEELERQHAADAAANHRMQQENRELERHRAQAAVEAAHAQQRNRELESRHQRDVAALERLKKEKAGGESWVWKGLLGVAGIVTGVAGAIVYQRHRKPDDDDRAP